MNTCHSRGCDEPYEFRVSGPGGAPLRCLGCASAWAELSKVMGFRVMVERIRILPELAHQKVSKRFAAIGADLAGEVE